MSSKRLTWALVLAILALAGFWKVPQVGGRSPAASASTRTAPSASTRSGRAPRPRPSASAAAARSDVFASATACAALVAQGARLARPSQSARFASWNLRWFPDGVPGNEEPGTDVAWLGCVIAWLDVDVLAVQEVKQTPKAERALASLLAELSRLTGRRYRARLDDCGRRLPQHVGLIFDEARVRASELSMVAELNPSGRPCEKQWRPGLSGRFAFPGGLDLFVTSAHFKSQSDETSLRLREASFAAVPGLYRRAERASTDGDWLLLGDLNTMGCEACQPPVSAASELEAAARRLETGGLRVVPVDAVGTELHRGRYVWLDHALASSSMRELAANALLHVAGPCGQSLRGSRAGRHPLSDHCPVVLDLSDRDLD